MSTFYIETPTDLWTIFYQNLKTQFQLIIIVFRIDVLALLQLLGEEGEKLLIAVQIVSCLKKYILHASTLFSI